MSEPTTPSPIPARADIPAAETWDLAPLYPTDAAWEADFARLDDLLAPVLALQGKLNGAPAVASLFAAEEALDRTLEKLYTYAHLAHDTDTAEPTAQAREARIRARYAELAAACAWITPELLSHPADEIAAWQSHPPLAPHRRRLEKLLRDKPHVLTKAEETLLARVSEVLSASGETYSLMANADLTFPSVATSDPAAAPLPLTEGTYRTYLESPDRTLRRNAFTTLHGEYGHWKNTFASTLSYTVKEHVATAQIRHFSTAREAALFDDQVPTAVYDALIAAARDALPIFARYLSLRKRALRLDDLDFYDLYTPLVPSVSPTVPPALACEWVLDACAPLGPDYLTILRTAFASRWIDWRENAGKQSGAYSSGCYDSAPYLLLNHHDRLDDAFTLAHELGHSAHTFLSNHAQPYPTSSYPIFIAEIASTVNELLLSAHLLEREPAGNPLHTHLLGHLCDSFKGTVFRQTMFAEFERDIHAAEEAGTPLTADWLCTAYTDLNRIYYPGLDLHPSIAYEWCRIPHFYYDFYVYKYATSFCAALVFARRIRAGQNTAAYLDLLRSGGSRPPLEAVAAAGVDLSDPAVFREAFAEFETVLDRLEAALP